MILVALILFGFSLLLAIGEVYFEWDASRERKWDSAACQRDPAHYQPMPTGWGKLDWPRETFRYVLIFGAILLMALAGH